MIRYWLTQISLALLNESNDSSNSKEISWCL